ncbi:MAG: 4-(cytidine 5'-diphospho)-2-C-methyl-D-erythritol kinase [Thermodesulfobacteriota bacterium]|nr:MAG: 4-(cytidine 5'-diphospho)-2-C-methyl-D-erythritol kinase [Thermodesulfobacteriota bacterium]
MKSETTLSPAKINLLLKVIRKRDDGFHDIFTVMQPVTLFDKISMDVYDGDGIRVECAHADVPTDDSNLAFRAAALFLERTGLKKRVEIVIDKSIPVGAGLGGGSSNAAAVLMLMNDMLSAGLGTGELMEMAGSLGSDVPFFILKGPAVATGRGEVLRRVQLPSFHYILINPGFKVSTQWAYGNFDLTKPSEDNMLSYSDESFVDPLRLKDSLVNDLETVTSREFPEILTLKDLLIESGADGALMSGSGPTVFGVFPSEGGAKGAFESLKERLGKKGYSVFLVRGL